MVKNEGRKSEEREKKKKKVRRFWVKGFVGVQSCEGSWALHTHTRESSHSKKIVYPVIS
jgi:hypothetical protein